MEYNTSKFKPTSHPTITHHFSPRLIAIEHLAPSTPPSPIPQPQATNFIIFLGGLGDGLRCVEYPLTLAHHLSAHKPSYTTIELLLSSSYTGWTTSSLPSDADELAQAVSYFRTLQATRSTTPGKIILLGHSTGSQILAFYTLGPHISPTITPSALSRPAVDGIILQAGISDREALSTSLTPEFIAQSLGHARDMVAAGNGEDQVPHWVTKGFFGANPTARRWLSLLSDKVEEADDDYFSSDLPDGRVERVWGKEGFGGRGVPVMVLMSGSDQYMPKEIDKAGLVKERWRKRVKEAGGKWCEESGVVEGATHNLNGDAEEIVGELVRRVEAFIDFVEKEG